jgi:hypothetical protein
MGGKAKNGGMPPEQRPPRGSKALIAASVPFYLGLAWLIAALLPEYSFFALVPVAFAIHSAAVLIGRRSRPN